MDRPGVVRARDELRYLRVCRIGHVKNTPSAAPEVTHVEVPVVVHVPDGHFERAAAPVQTAVPNRLHVARFPAGRNLVGIAALNKHRYNAYNDGGAENNSSQELPH